MNPNPEPLPLDTLQRWMSVVIEHSRDAAAGARSAAGRSMVPLARLRHGDVVKGAGPTEVYRRLDVYNGGYFARLKEALESDFAGLVHALGEPGFRHLALGYVRQHPSRHPNLNVFNRHLPVFLGRQRDLPNRAFLRDLAELEVRITMAFDAEEFTPLDTATLHGLTPEQWQCAVLVTNPSLQLMVSGYPVNAYLQAVYDGEQPEIPGRSRTCVAIYRKDDSVWRHVMPRPAFGVLSALAEGQPLATALERAKGAADFRYWFADWAADGLFTEVIAPTG
ncbi:MAG: putative DNA-binding domain-containing protein [Planctomycetes bacterium]|nr:putative DNA-binding domain-containing protein [Planctomycetota bacterium]MCB9872355.1 putative DNA-binding domain-containing protein [Planctomycetota bacterium]MCB9888941.1 putative DNA-binding domain-containing protein [Planctomycetota bacterium]